MRPRLSDLLFPVAAHRVAPLELALVFLLGTTVAFFRLGDIALRGSVSAEDGQVFLQTALLHHGLAALFEPYGGYMHMVPRTLTMLVVTLPAAGQGIALNLAAALVQAAVAALVYVGISGFVRARLWRALAALAVVAVPVGTEVIASVANLQWFLLAGGCVGLFWTPRKPLGWGALFVVLLTATMSSPFAVILLAGALFRLLVQRSRPAFVLASVVATGFVVQTMVMLHAPARTGINTFGVDLAPVRLIGGFVTRVLGDGVFGVGRHSINQPSLGLVAGLVVVSLLVVLVITLSTRAGLPALFGASVFGALAVLTYSLPVVATPALPTGDAFSANRYYVAPALLTIVAIMCLFGGVSDLRGRRTVRFRWLAVAVRAALVASLLWGLGSSWTAGSVGGRQNDPTWQSGIAQARKDCAASSAKVSVIVPISPPGWAVTLTCAEVDK